MADNFKAPVTPIFNGEQFELIDGKIISSKGGGSLNIKFKKDSTSGLYECDKSFEDIKQAIADFKDINIQFPNEDGTVSYDKWYIKTTDNSTTITFASGRYENTLLNERCWIEENVVMPSTYVSGASLALAQNIVYSRDYKIKYDVNDDDYEGAWPSPRLASEIKPFHGDFQFVPADNVVPSGTAGGKAFQGWFYDEGCTTKINFGDVAGVDPDAITHDVRAYAKWKADLKGVVFNNEDTKPITLKLKPNGTPVAADFEYSFDGSTWIDYLYTDTVTLDGTYGFPAGGIVVPEGVSVAFKRKSTAAHPATEGVSNGLSLVGSSYYSFTSDGHYSLEGNIAYLVDPIGTATAMTNNNEFIQLFQENIGDGKLLSVSKDFLSNFTNVKSGAYRQMFYRCSALKQAPDLPASYTANQAYSSMFEGCTSLVIPPSLSALRTASKQCCEYMFKDCTNLEALPALYTNYISSQYNFDSMFRGCTKIKVSETQDGEYTNLYRIPMDGTATGGATSPGYSMFTNTGGTFTGEMQINTNYYTSNPVVE